MQKNWRLSKSTDKTSIIFYRKTRATVVQGKPNALFSLFVSFYTELIPDFDLITAYSKMRQRRINVDEIDLKVKELNLPSDYPKDCIKLIKQALSEYFVLSKKVMLKLMILGIIYFLRAWLIDRFNVINQEYRAI